MRPPGASFWMKPGAPTGTVFGRLLGRAPGRFLDASRGAARGEGSDASRASTVGGRGLSRAFWPARGRPRGGPFVVVWGSPCRFSSSPLLVLLPRRRSAKSARPRASGSPASPRRDGVATFCGFRFGQFPLGATTCPARVVLAILPRALSRNLHAPAAGPNGWLGGGPPLRRFAIVRRPHSLRPSASSRRAHTSLRFAVLGFEIAWLAPRLHRAFRPRNSSPRSLARCPAARRWPGRVVGRGASISAITVGFRAVRRVSGCPPAPGAPRASPRFAVSGSARRKEEG